MRNLSSDEAVKEHPVLLSGTLLLVTRHRDALVLRDETDGIYVELNHTLGSTRRPGDRLEVSGVTSAGDFAPMVRASRIRWVGTGPLPPPRATTTAELNAGGFDAAWVELETIVRSCRPSPLDPASRPRAGAAAPPNRAATAPTGPESWEIIIAQGDDRMTVQLLDRAAPMELVDAKVKLRGVVFNVHNANRQFVRASVQVAHQGMIEVLTPPPPNPFSVPLQRIDEILRFTPTGFSGHRIRVRGVVTAHRQGRTLWLRDGDRGLRVASDQDGALVPGDVVEMVGFADHGGYAPNLNDAIFRKISSGSPPVPIGLLAAEEISRQDSNLVRIEATLDEVRETTEGVLLALSWNGAGVSALLPRGAGGLKDARWEPRSRVSATGIRQARPVRSLQGRGRKPEPASRSTGNRETHGRSPRENPGRQVYPPAIVLRLPPMHSRPTTKRDTRNIPMRLPCVLLLLLAISQSIAAPVSVTVDVKLGMRRAGEPYFVKGAGGETELERLAARGANSIRTWDTANLEKTLTESERLGLTVSAGIWLENESSWFSYSKPEDCAKQTQRVRQQVLKFRDHPALLAWGLGNESEGDGTNVKYWQQLERLALLVKEIDPAHPTFTAVAGLRPASYKGLNQYTPHLDYVGANTYGGLFSVREFLGKVEWTRPWLVTEWGPQGYWERPKSQSGRPLEQASAEKAAMIAHAYEQVIAPGSGCMGSYAFIWGWKFEASATWFGLLTHAGETTPVMDVLEEKWAGRKPANRAPAIEAIQGMPSDPMRPGAKHSVHAKATDPEGDSLSWTWSVLPEVVHHEPGSKLPMPAAIPNTVIATRADGATLQAPDKPGHYRLYVWISDGKGHAATANIPFESKDSK